MDDYRAASLHGWSSVATDWAHVFTIRDGKLVKFREHTDSAKIVDANQAASSGGSTERNKGIVRRWIDDGWAPPKAGFWVLHIAPGGLSALEHHALSD